MNISLANKITKINDETFAFSTLSGEIFLPDSIKEIGDYSFYNTNITSINLPPSLKIIGEKAFAIDNETTNTGRGLSCNITIPASITEIGIAAFYNTSIISLNFSLANKITKINNRTFAFCCQLQEEIKIPNSIKAIYEFAFAYTSITSVIFGDNLEYLDDYTFFYCCNLKCSISFPKSLRHVGHRCFYASSINGTIDGSNIEFIGEECFGLSHITGFIFSSKIKKIPNGLFYSSQLSGEIILPEYTEEIGNHSFAFTQITKINFPVSLKIVKMSAFFSCNKLKNYFRYIQVNYIGAFAFYGCTSLTGNMIIFADFINMSAFLCCSNIEVMEIWTSSSIESCTFEYCTSLKSIKIISKNNSVYNIGPLAFAFCTSLEEIVLPKEIKEISYKAFYMCSSYSGKLDLTIYPNLDVIDDEAYFGCNKLFGEIRFPESLKAIGNGSFTGCSITGSLIIPNSVESIDSYAFFKCTGLSGIISIGDGVTEIGDSAFALCSNIAGNIIIGQKVEIIHDRAFFGCSSITGNLILPPSIKEIRDAAFYNCASLKGELSLPNNLQIIGESAFAECAGLTGTLKIPKSTKQIGKNAFFNCKGFDDVRFEDSSTNVGIFAFYNMNIKCFSKAPQNVRKNNPPIYSSGEFKGKMLLIESFLNFNCTAFYVIDGILVALTTLGSAGVLSTVAMFVFNWCKNKKTNIKKYKDVFNSIIEQARLEKDIHDDEIAERIINKINERLFYECNDEDFTMTESQAIKALNESIEESWSIICIQQKRKILERSFTDINFKDPLCKCKCKCNSKSTEQGEYKLENESSDSIVMTTLL